MLSFQESDIVMAWSGHDGVRVPNRHAICMVQCACAIARTADIHVATQQRHVLGYVHVLATYSIHVHWWLLLVLQTKASLAIVRSATYVRYTHRVPMHHGEYTAAISADLRAPLEPTWWTCIATLPLCVAVRSLRQYIRLIRFQLLAVHVMASCVVYRFCL